MKKAISLLCMISTVCVLPAQADDARSFGEILPSKTNTLDAKKQWFDAAKFGIFVHWNFSSITGEKPDKSMHPLLDPASPFYRKGAKVKWPESYQRAVNGTEISWGRIGPRPGKGSKNSIVNDHFTVMPYAQYNLLYEKFEPKNWTPGAGRMPLPAQGRNMS